MADFIKQMGDVCFLNGCSFFAGKADSAYFFYPFGNEGMFFRQTVEFFLGQVSQPETPALFAVEELIGTEQFFNPFGRLRLEGDEAVFFFCGKDEIAAFDGFVAVNHFGNVA